MASNAITSQSVMGFARAQIDKTARLVTINRNSALDP
jgi:hypothetical protein